MKSYDQLNNMDLPFVNPNENLETLSNQKFIPLFDVEKFEIRAETNRDKGIDFHIELKGASKYTNFRFAIQLKATETKEANADGSISLQINTSNINYLLNGGVPSFYVLYNVCTETFYYEDIKTFVNQLYSVKPNWEEQSSHTLRFIKILNKEATEEMYNSTLENGRFQRTITERLALKSSTLHPENRIVLDANFSVTDDNEIRQLVEVLGFELLNEGKWSELVSVHKKGSGNIASSARYNLVLGIANHYLGHLSEAISFFKVAIKLKNELPSDLQNHLMYFDLSTRYSIGILSLADYLKSREEVEQDDEIGLYIKIDSATRKYTNSLDLNSEKRFQELVADLQTVIENPKANLSIQLHARSEMALFQGYKNNMEYVRNIAMLNAKEAQIGVDLEARKESAVSLINANRNWLKEIDEIKREALDAKNYFAFYTAVMHQVKVLYEFSVYTNLIRVEQDFNSNVKTGLPDQTDYIKDLLKMINGALTYFNQIGHVNNLCASLSAKYELEHYSDDLVNANITLGHLESLVNDFDIKEQKRKFEFIKKNGTTHENFKNWLAEMTSTATANRQEFDSQNKELQEMDLVEGKIKNKMLDGFKIQLFPIGHFHFPKDRKDKAFEILNLEENAKRTIEYMINNGIIPVVNIYYTSIAQEGYADGNLAQNQINGWQNIYRIRKSFFENNFYRIIIS